MGGGILAFVPQLVGGCLFEGKSSAQEKLTI